MFHLDSSTVVLWSRGREARLAERFVQTDTRDLALSFVSEAELRVGLAKSRFPGQHEALLTFIKAVRIVESDPEIVRHYVGTRVRLEQVGQRMSDNDLWIAATALAEGATLVTTDEAFARVPGLKTENWRV